MGIFDFVRQGVQEMLIQRPDASKGLIVFKHPDGTIPHYAQLTVDADEAAVFFRDGALVGTLRTAGAGQRHTLAAQNIPFLGRIVDNVTGGNIFVTDLYFVTMRPIYEQRFGGELGYVEDPLLGEMVTPRIFGEFAFQIFDPERFLLNYVGMRQPEGNDQVTRWITGLFMNGVKQVIGEVCVTEQKSILQLLPLQDQIGRAVLARSPDLTNIGVRILQIGQFNINLNDDDQNRLREAQSEIGKAKRAERVARIGVGTAQASAQQRQFELDQRFEQDKRYVEQVAGNYGSYAAGRAMIGAGEGMAKGGGDGGGVAGPMMAGAGMAAGVGMAHAMVGAFQVGAQPAVAPAAAKAPAAGTASCPSCKARVPGGKFCAECGSALAPQPKFCSSCGVEAAPTAKFCQNCGTGFAAGG